MSAQVRSSGGCPLCAEAGGLPVHQAPQFRVVRVDDADFPAYYRVIWTEHLAEFSDLDAAQRQRLMEAVCAVETVLRRQLQPRKINLAAFGNLVPHLHWHVIARFEWDSHFPQPSWGQRQRPSPAPEIEALRAHLTDLDELMRKALAAF